MITRQAQRTVEERLSTTAAVALLGPRQIGKTTLARDLVDRVNREGSETGAVYLDLERPADIRRLADADGFLRKQAPHLVVLDEVHRVPDLFPILRGVIDDNRRQGFREGQFLLLGSGSLDLLHFSSESLAGRISIVEMSGITLDEAEGDLVGADQLWLRGGFPDSLLQGSDAQSLRWRADFIRSYLEREIPFFAPRIPGATLGRLWTMIAHNSGALLNASRLGESLAVSSPTVDRYVDLLVDLGLLRRLQPWYVNLGKRLVKSPKIYVRDSGLLHALLEIENQHQLLGHPSVGASFESFALENLIAAAGDSYSPHFYRTARGAELDLVLVKAGKPEIGIEVKLSTAPSVTSGFHGSINDLGLSTAYVVTPGDAEPYATSDTAQVVGLGWLLSSLR